MIFWGMFGGKILDNQNRFLNIDFLKVFGCLCVVLYHMCSAKMGIYMHLNVPLYEILKDSCNLGYLAVDLFFIISGLFFALRTDFSKPLTDFLTKI